MHTDPDVKNVSLTSGTIVRAILFVLLFFFLYVARDLILIILTAVVIASAIEPITRWFSLYGVPRVLTVVGIYAASAILISVVVYFLLPPLLAELSTVMAKAPEYLSAIQSSDTLQIFSPPGAVTDATTTHDALNSVQGLLSIASGGALSFVSAIFGGLFSFFLIVVMSFYMSVQKDGITHFLRAVMPFKYETYAVDLWTRSQRKIGRWLYGQLTLSLFVGVLVFVGLALLKVPNALLLGVLASLLELVPFFGPILAGVPGVAFALTTGGLTLGLLAFALYFFVQQVENHVLQPLVVGKVVGVPALIVIIALVLGGTLAGFLGILLSVPVAAVVMEYMGDVDHRKQQIHRKYHEFISAQESAHG